MKKLKYFLLKNRLIIIIGSIILICAVAIAIGVYAQITNRKVINKKEQEVNHDYEDLQNNFDDIFTNSINLEATAKQNLNYKMMLQKK